MAQFLCTNNGTIAKYHNFKIQVGVKIIYGDN